MMKRILILTIAVVLAALCFALPVGAESPTTGEDASAVETGGETTITPTESEKAPSALDWLKELYEAIPEEERDKYTEAVLGAAEIFKDAAPNTPAEFIHRFCTEHTWAAVLIVALVALAIGALGFALKCKGTGMGALKDSNKLKTDTINAFANAYNEVNAAMGALAEQALTLGACAASFAKVAEKMDEKDAQIAELAKSASEEAQRSAQIAKAAGEVFAAQERAYLTIIERSALSATIKEDLAEQSRKARKEWEGVTSHETV
jgi:hypothetical protein